MPSERWTIDATLSSLTFKIAHLSVSTIRGTFSDWGGMLQMDDQGLSSSRAEIWVGADSVGTHEEARDAEARSGRFLDVDRFPRIEFSSTAVEMLDATSVVVTGDLTLHGLTRPVRVDATYRGRATDGAGRVRAVWDAALTVRREEFGLLWHPALEQVSGFLLGDEIEVSIDLEVVLVEA
jgi:polyisoprenoid-binding protein YceI